MKIMCQRHIIILYRLGLDTFQHTQPGQLRVKG